MKLSLYTAFFLMVTSSLSFAQPFAEGCDGTRYAFQVFNDVTKTTVKYATTKPENKDLFIDIYQPSNDLVKKRPLILFAHGGGFLFGDKADMAAFCTFWAQRGFVTASIQYRLFSGIPSQSTMYDAATKAVSDMKAAYRFFKSDASNQNSYLIDTTKMFIGGYSAGAITALLTGYMDTGDPIDPTTLNIINANGGFSGNTGDTENLSHNDKDIFGVFNMSGAVFTKGLLDQNEPFLMSYHGDIDDTVPIDSNSVFFGLAYLYGSRTIHKEADAISLPNTLTVAAGGNHTDIYSDPKYAGTLGLYVYNSINLFYPRLCGISLSTHYANRPALNIHAYPNPVSDYINIECKEKVDEIWLCSSKGEIVLRKNILSNNSTFNVSNFESGSYIIIPIKGNTAYKPISIQVIR